MVNRAINEVIKLKTYRRKLKSVNVPGNRKRDSNSTAMPPTSTFFDRKREKDTAFIEVARARPKMCNDDWMSSLKKNTKYVFKNNMIKNMLKKENLLKPKY